MQRRENRQPNIHSNVSKLPASPTNKNVAGQW